ncbi:hypothetical protein REIP_0153 [Rickettsia endosymbiont of Ixodes pacificus]|uniref:transposase n=1 Tax=Rickettsia endosymbiont of Ixodes pacificus TaxID=1133329 RepID=UPI00061F9A2A|nr:transposase [Rickettsia endosymbiont of Ixodes pacificus]KJW02150.1 hypothetical protein REIP_0153 [Rickettsia endosymbiont of Ixodes pacificus]
MTIIANSNTGVDYIKSALSYSLTKIDQTDKIELENMLKTCLNPKVEEEIMGSIAHHWLQEGIEKGIQIGEMKLAEMAKKMLRKNKPLDEIIEFTGLTEREIEELK